MMKKTGRLTAPAALTALSLMINLAENALPPLFVPGARLGLSNLVTLLALFALGPLDALFVLTARTLLAAIFSGVSALIYSLPAGLCALAVSILLAKLVYPGVTVTAISVMAAVLHNITQNLIFCAVTSSPGMLLYTPYLALTGALAGLVVGLAARLLLRRLGGYISRMSFITSRGILYGREHQKTKRDN